MRVKLSGIRTFKKAGVTVFTGCTRHPQPNSKYCWEHQSGDSPVVPASSVSSRTRQQLSGYRAVTNYSEQAGNDQFYIVERIDEIKVEDDKKVFKVKWLGYPESTWEGEDRLPGFIKKYYTDNVKRVGSILPNPRIKHTKKVGGSEVHLLSWEGESGSEWVHEDFFHYLSEEGEVLNSNMTVSCNTRKSRDKTCRRHTVGVFVGAYTCGTIVLFDELYGSESISQVYGILIEFLSRLDDVTNLKEILYDDFDMEVEEEAEHGQEHGQDHQSASQDFPFTQSQTEETIKVCQVCRFATRNKLDLKDHMKTHHQCAQCGQFYLSKKELDYHVQNHMKVKCDLCSMDVRKDELFAHKFNHEKLKTFGRKVKKPKLEKTVTG